jgi:hypothetical protein
LYEVIKGANNMKVKLDLDELQLEGNGITSKEQADAVWEAYVEHRTKAEELLKLWGEWAKKAR